VKRAAVTARAAAGLAPRAFLLGLLAAAGPAAAGPAGPSRAYVEILERYARGERAAAVADLGDWNEGQLERQLGALRDLTLAAERCPACPTPADLLLLPAAAMLHTDRDEAERPSWSGVEQSRPCPGVHARLAGEYAELMALRPESRDFARRFFLAMAMRCQWDFCLDEAAAWGREGLKRFPRDAELLLTVGSADEEAATLSDDTDLWFDVRSHRQISSAGAARVRRFRDAERSLADAVNADPKLLLARVHLGRVRWRLGSSDEARSVLEELLERARDPELLYLAHLFLGRVHDDADRGELAIREYRLALEAAPRSQAAAVALSHALKQAGDGEGARQALVRTLALAGRRSGRDPYWDYLMANAASREDLFAELRRETLR
jgi:tetratricopeptide (TPR) repeat protein